MEASIANSSFINLPKMNSDEIRLFYMFDKGDGSPIKSQLCVSRGDVVTGIPAIVSFNAVRVEPASVHRNIITNFQIFRCSHNDPVKLRKFAANRVGGTSIIAENKILRNQFSNFRYLGRLVSKRGGHRLSTVVLQHEEFLLTIPVDTFLCMLDSGEVLDRRDPHSWQLSGDFFFKKGNPPELMDRNVDPFQYSQHINIMERATANRSDKELKVGSFYRHKEHGVLCYLGEFYATKGRDHWRFGWGKYSISKNKKVLETTGDVITKHKLWCNNASKAIKMFLLKQDENSFNSLTGVLSTNKLKLIETGEVLPVEVQELVTTFLHDFLETSELNMEILRASTPIEHSKFFLKSENLPTYI